MSTSNNSTSQSSNSIIIQGAKVNNLKNINVSIPRNKLVVITGLSGSGKSSLAFDTLYAEGQRRYVESLSSYARQFLGRMNKPEVDFIKGITPAIAIEQKVSSRSPRSTVGTATEIYEYIKLLYSRVGKTYSPISGNLVKRHTVTDVVDSILNFPTGTKISILSPIHIKSDRTPIQHLQILLQQGYSRVKIKNEVFRIDELLETQKDLSKHPISILIDRIIVKDNDDEFLSRVSDSVQTAFYESEGTCVLEVITENETKCIGFNDKFEADGISFEEPSPNFFSFNNPFGACKKCEGFGSIIGIDEDLVIPDKTLSIYQDAVACWKGEKMSEFKEMLIRASDKVKFPIHRPYEDLTQEEKDLLWNGSEYFMGINDFFKDIETQIYKIQFRVMLARYRGKTTCPDCHGTRLRKDAGYVLIGGKSIIDLVLMPIEQVSVFFKELNLTPHDAAIAKRLLTEIKNRLEYMEQVGLGYLTLNRGANTLSGGESQRMNLARSLGSSLVGSTYILDEPSIGLHPRDTQHLLNVLQKLRNAGNTVVVVEHDEEIISAADYIIDIGPLAGTGGGEVVFAGTSKDLIHAERSLTAQYLTKKLEIALPNNRRPFKDFIQITGAKENNLKNLNVKIPLNMLTVVTGVSGSGKTSLIKNVLTGALQRHFGNISDKTGKFKDLTGDLHRISQIEFVDQNPIGRSTRSNPVTYIKAFDDIRELFSQQQISKLRGYKPGFFSFNVPGGRCDECEGEGIVTIEMQFMADIHLVCESCKGARYKEEVLDVTYNSKNISEILDLTVSEALEFFKPNDKSPNLCKKIIEKIQPLEDVGLGYLKLGQSSSTLSGGEAQRIKLASFLSKNNSENRIFFIFDEPTTGLHLHDINKLLTALNALINQGHSVLVIEHNLQVIKCADWIIDLGPTGGNEGGNLVYEGTPEGIVNCEKSFTGSYLKNYL